jgi:hypothetical protein
MEEFRKGNKIVVGKSEGKRQSAKLIHKCEDNTEMDLRKIQY